MAATFCEPGGDLDYGIGLWAGGNTGSPVVATDFVHGYHTKSIKYPVSTVAYVYTPTSTLVTAGGRFSYWIYINALPSAISSLGTVYTNALAGIVFRPRISSAGVLSIYEATNQIGQTGPTLTTGTWYRISMAYTITSTTVNQFNLWVNGNLAISVVNATITNTTASILAVGNTTGTTLDMRSSDHYVDQSTSLTDPGNVWVTAKRAYSSGTTTSFTTAVGSGSGYGTGDAAYINYRPFQTSSGRAVTTTGTGATEEFTIEPENVGDANIAPYTILGSMSWVYILSTAGGSGDVIATGNNTTISWPTGSATSFVAASTSSSYPGGGTDVGVVSPNASETCTLYGAGMAVAYIVPLTAQGERSSNAASSGGSAATTLTINAPSDLQQYDVMLANIIVSDGSSGTLTAPSGWTLIARSNESTTVGQGVYYKVATASEGASYQWTVTSARVAGNIVAYIGMDPNNPIAGFASKNTATATTTPAPTATIPQCETPYGVVCFGGHNTTAVSIISAASTNYTQYTDICTTATPFMEASIENGANYTLPIASITPGTFTITESSAYSEVTVFLRPSLSNVWKLATDVATYAETASSPETSLAFGTGYNNEWAFLFISENSASFSETCTVSGTTLSWSLMARANNASVVTGSSEVWYAKVATPLAFNSETVTITPSTSGSTVNASIYTFINSWGPGASTPSEVASGTPSLSVTTTGALSWVWATLMDVTASTSPTIGSNQTEVQIYKPSGESMWVWRETAQTTATNTSVTLSVTAPTGINYSMVVAEILFANPTGKDINNLNNTLGYNGTQAVNRAGTY